MTIQMNTMDEYVALASDVHGQLPLLITLAALMGLGKGGVPGFATIATAATVLTAPSGALGYAVSLQVPILTMIDVYAAWLHSDQLDWPTVRLLVPLSLVGMALGQAADARMSDAAARIVVGTILLAILVLRTWRSVVEFFANSRFGAFKRYECKESDTEEEEHGDEEEMVGLNQQQGMIHWLNQNGVDQHSATTMQKTNKNNTVCSTFGWAAVVGIVGGAATMLTNSMGPILNVYLLSVRKLPPASYIGTRAMFFCFLNMGKLPMRFAAGTLGLQMLPLAAGLGLVSVVGVFFGKPIMMSMSERTFVALELSVVAFARLRLLYMGVHSMS